MPGNNSRAFVVERQQERMEITLYGEIVERRPEDWTGKAEEGEYIVQSEFLDALSGVSGVQSLHLRINSIGGDAGVALLIHNRLRELADSGVKLSCTVDGVAMSGGSLIMCACDNVSVNPASLIMIHQASVFLFGGYNAVELRETASACEKWDEAQASIYQRKTGLEQEKILGMMKNTTYMTGQEAVEKGFADELVTDAEPLEIAASADRARLIVRGRSFPLPHGMSAPDSVPEQTKRIGGDTMIRNYSDFKAENPELAQQLEQEVLSTASAAQTSAEQERERLQAIDKVAEFCPPEIVQEAKYGEKACSAQEMLFRAAERAKEQGQKFLADLTADTRASGVQDVTAEPGATEPDDNSRATVEANAKAAVARYMKAKGGASK
ncbi:MAG: Clp protease ClpP [Oscillibacter sp.]|nr:Clp protease ClpP [Oscillibacter sp.]